MAKAFAISALAAAPTAAFVQDGHLRAQRTPAQTTSGIQAPAASAPAAPSLSASAVLALGGLGGAAAIAGSSRRQARVQCRVAGVSLPLTEKWDPLNLSDTDEKLEKYTVAEIKHGRIAMIAVIGYIMPEFYVYPGCETFGHGLKALETIPVEGLVQLFLFIGAHDILVKPREGGMGSYDLGLGTELLEGQPAEEVERKQTSERNNGRLAMVAIIGLLWQDAQFGENPIASLGTNGFWGPSVDYFIRDIPICMVEAGNTGAMCAEGPEMSPSVPFLKYPTSLKGWAGEEKGFDPIAASDGLPVYALREAELKHGRICMLATIGWIATDLGLRFPAEVFQNVSTIEAHNKMVAAGYMQPMLGFVGALEIYSGYLYINGQAETIKRDAGDYWLGKNFLPSDPAGERDMRLKELENGRLAMLAFGGICTMAVVSQKPWPFF